MQSYLSFKAIFAISTLLFAPSSIPLHSINASKEKVNERILLQKERINSEQNFGL